MIIKTKTAQYAVDLKARKLYGPDKTLVFDGVKYAYYGTTEVAFYLDDEKILTIENVTDVEGSPLDSVRLTEDTTLVYTSSTVYELDTARKRIRRVVGLNDPTDGMVDGEWRDYGGIGHLRIGCRLTVVWPTCCGITTSRVKRIRERITTYLGRAA